MTPPTRILLIDDDQIDRASARRALAKSGLAHELVEAADGTSGLALAQAHTFDFILLDYRLPDVDTFELLARLLSPDGGKHAVLMLTGESDPEIALALMRAGALDYLSKSEMTPANLARSIRYAKARREVLAELEQRSLELDRLNQQKTMLFSIIAHDLRTPFQVILSVSELLSQNVEAKEPNYIERRAQGIHEAAAQAYGLMEGLFAWADLQMNTATVTLSDVDVSEVTAETVGVVSRLAVEKSIEITLDCSPIKVTAHREMLATILRNLIGNAIKFTNPGGKIVIAATQSAKAGIIAVRDNGVGISPDRITDLFRLDRRSSSKGTAGESGRGFGLLLCRDLAERQGGTLTVESVVNGGTTFTLTLPMAECPLSEPVQPIPD